MNKSKIIKVICIIIFLIIFLFFIGKMISNHNKVKMQDGSDTKDDPYKGNELEVQGTVYEENTKSTFYMIKSAVEKYFNFCKEYNNSEFPLDVEEIYNLLLKEYVDEYNINYNNISNYITDINATSVRIDKMLSTQFVDGSADIYIVEGEALNENEFKSQEFSFIVVVDYNKDNFALCLDDYYSDKGYENVKVGDKITAITSSIDNGNKINYEYKNDETFLKEVFTEFKNDSIFFQNRAYSHLNDETINNKFQNIDNFSQYVNENKKDIYLDEITNFITDYDIENGITTYKCVDKYEKQIIFTFYSLTDYKVTISD